MSAKMFFTGLAVRLIGAAMIWLGDGHSHVAAKVIVVVGVILSVGGIAVLRFMLFKSFKVAHFARRQRRQANRPASLEGNGRDGVS